MTDMGWNASLGRYPDALEQREFEAWLAEERGLEASLLADAPHDDHFDHTAEFCAEDDDATGAKAA